MNSKLSKNILIWGLNFASYIISIYAVYYIMVRYLRIPHEDSRIFLAFIFIPATGLIIYLYYKGYKTIGAGNEISLDFLVENISSPKYVKMFFWLISPMIICVITYIYYFMASFLVLLLLSFIPINISTKSNGILDILIGIISLIFSIITYYYMWKIYSNKSNKDKLQ